MMMRKLFTVLFSLVLLLSAQSVEEMQSLVDDAARSLTEGNIMGAEMTLQSVLMQDSTFAPALYSYHLLALQKGDLNEALVKLKSAITNKPDDEDYRTRFESVNSLVNKLKDAKRELDAGQIENSKRIYGEIIEAFPTFAEPYYLLGIVNLREDDYKGSSTNFRKASELNPDEMKYSSAMNNLIGKYFQDGMTAYKMNDFVTAEEKFRITLEIDPTFVNAYMQIGVMKRKSGDLDGAITCLEKGVEAAPEDDKSRYNLGLFYKSANRNSDAREQFSKTIELNPDFSKAYSSLAGIQVEEKQFPQAESNYAKSIELDPSSASAWDGYGALLMQQKKYAQAKEALDNATRLAPRNYPGFYRLAECNNYLGNYQEAIDAAEKALRLNRRFAPANIEKGFALFRLDRKQESIAAFNAARTDPGWRSYAEHQIELIRDGKEVER